MATYIFDSNVFTTQEDIGFKQTEMSSLRNVWKMGDLIELTENSSL